MRPGSYRSYSSPLIFLVLAAVAVGVGYLVLKEEKVDTSKRPQIHFSGSTLQQAGQVPDNIKAPPPPDRRIVRFDSKPAGARVLINDQLADGLTPIEASDVAGGTAQIRMIQDGNKRYQTSLKPGQTHLTAELTALNPKTQKNRKPSLVDVTTTPPGAEVSIDGKSIGITPLTGVKYERQGQVAVILKKNGYYAHTVLTRMVAGRTQSIGARLSPKASERSAVQINVESNPHGATIERVRPTGQPSWENRLFALVVADRLGNTITLRGSLAGHTPTERRFDLVTTDYTVKLHLDTPTPSYGFVTVQGPRGLSVYLGSEELDRLPLQKRRLKTGNHRLTVVDQKNRKRQVHNFTVSADATSTLTIKATADGPVITAPAAR